MSLFERWGRIVPAGAHAMGLPVGHRASLKLYADIVEAHGRLVHALALPPTIEEFAQLVTVRRRPVGKGDPPTPFDVALEVMARAPLRPR